MWQKMLKTFLVFFLTWQGSSAFAQAPEGGGDEKAQLAQDIGWEFGLNIGNLLPNQISGVTEIMGLGGFMFAYNLAPASFLETQFLTGNGDGAKWKNMAINIRMDVPIETMLALAYVGGDITHYQGAGESTKTIFGGHAGGGIQVPIGAITWFRADMKFSVSPGTSLYIGASFIFRFPSGGGGGSS